MSSNNTYDVVIIGGGLAGLSASIVLARKQYNVLLLEKESYPKHKVCGEYISMESKPFLQSLGIPVDDMNLPVINKLQVTDARGNELNATLPQGGFGISRYKLDAALAELAQATGATLLTRTRAENVHWENDCFTVTAKGQQYKGKVVLGSWGKRSNIDVKWHRPFIKEKISALNNYVAVKYHISYPWPVDVVGLHNFDSGYCGISQVEDHRTCLCYLTTAASLHKCGNDIKKLEQDVVMKNPWLNNIFSNAEFLYESPVTISQISFEKKSQVEEHVLLLGDAAGMITPLCGNGMSMALRAAKTAAALNDDFLQARISRAEMEQSYISAWKNAFSKRISLGRFVQRNFGKGSTTALFIKTINVLPFVRKALINGTSGQPF
jgi:flavin-dependent dehydrogenase